MMVQGGGPSLVDLVEKRMSGMQACRLERVQFNISKDGGRGNGQGYGQIRAKLLLSGCVKATPLAQKAQIIVTDKVFVTNYMRKGLCDGVTLMPWVKIVPTCKAVHICDTCSLQF